MYHVTDFLSSSLKKLRRLRSNKPYASLSAVVRTKDNWCIGGWYKAIFLSSVTKRQIAVLTQLPCGKVKLSIPIEGMGGWSVTLPSIRHATVVATREVTLIGKLYNRVVFMPWAFFHHDLN